VLSPWSTEYSTCSAQCDGGVQVRTRTVMVPAAFGGKPCDGSLTSAPQACNTNACGSGPSKIDCQVSDWSDWSVCTATCGGGTQQQTRTITVAAAYGGMTCPALFASRTCNTQTCPSPSPVDCVLSEYSSSWSTCQSSCGSGIQIKTRSVVTPAMFGGAACGSLTLTQPCPSPRPPCPSDPVDCVVSAFGDWSMCTATCNGGSQQRSRTVIRPVSNGGKACDALLETQMCNTHAPSLARLTVW